MIAVDTNILVYAHRSDSQFHQHADEALTQLAESGELWAILENSAVVGPMVHDARVAALCQPQGVREIWTADRDFSRFGGIKAKNPLLKPKPKG